MHSGSSISPKHPAIPVSIGIASLVLEGRSSALDDSSIHASSSASHGSGGGSGGDAGSGGEGGVGGAEGSSNGGGTGADEDGGFYGKKRPSSSSTSSSSSGSAASAGSSGGSSGGTTSANACTLQQCSLLAITEAHKMANANAAASCHMSDASQRINLKLQQIRSSCPGTSKDEVHHLVTVSGGEPGSGRGRASLDEDERQYGGMLYGVESFVNVASSGRFGGGSSSASACWAHESGPSAAQSPPHPSAVIYSGFEKMNVLGTVSPIKNHPIGNSFINFSSSPNSSLVAATAAAAAAAAAAASSSASRKATCSSSSGKQQQQQQHQQQQRPREGPHCEQFLKKIGLNKPDASDGPEHCCSYRNKYCLRWQVYFKQLSSILTNGEAVCIEVYLGPENHTILLEQWILKLVMTKSPTTMTLQSLCAAIRSQLYFSQISAWTDLIKNSLEPDIFNHPRIKKLPPSISPKHGASAAGKVAFLPQAKLDILFRIRTYDNTACFNEKPLVHNFPDANVADGFVIQVCLKSLPRLDRIPGIHAALDAAKMIGATGTAGMLPGDRLDLPCHEKGKHRCAFRELELDEDDEGEVDDPRMADGDEGTAGMLLTSAAINHREKQLLKYKKRMLKREKKKKSSGSGSVAADVAANGEACGSSNSSSSISSSSRSGAGNRNGSSVDSSAYASPMSYSSCSNGSGSGGGGVGGVRNSKSPSVGPYECGAVGNGTATTVYASVSTGGSCTNGSCHSALTSSINSIQPPLYSSNHAHQHSNNNAMMVCCEDRYHTIATSSKSTQTSSAGLPASAAGGALSFVSSVATQTDCGGAISAIGYCTDCCLSRERKHAVDTTPQGSGNHAQRAGHTSNGTPTATALLQRDAEIVLGTGGGSSSSTNSDRHMQYFNDYYRSYDIINENCDKRHPTPQPADSQRAHHRVADAPMETSTTTIGTEGTVVPDTASGSGTRRRACFIVGGDGYEGDEDEGDAEANGGERSMPNGGDERPLQKGDLLLQAIQRTATLNGGSTQNGSFARSSNYSRPLEDESGPQKHQQRDVGGGYALNNNNYVTANNNNIGECYKGRMDSNGAVAAAALGGEREANGELDGRMEPNGIVEGGNVEHHHHHQHAAGGSGNGGGGSLGPSAKCERSECDTFSKEKLDLGDCRLCKRQKTKHNFKLNLTNLLSSAVSSAVPSLKAASGRESAAKKTVITTVVDCGSTPPGCRRTLSESLVGHLTIPGCSGGSGANGAMTEAGGGCGSRGMGAGETSNGLYPNGGDLSPGDSPMMLSSSTGAVGNGGLFTFEQMKSYRRAFSEDVIDTITTTTANGSGRCLGNGRINVVHTATEDSTEDDDTSGDNENEHELDARERGPKRCGCASSPLPVEHRLVQGQTAHHRQHTSTPATGNGGKCKEPLYISCSETDCSVSTASSVSPHKKQILSCAAIGAGSGSRALDAGRPAGSPGGAPNVQQLMQYKSSPEINLNYVFCLSPLARDDSGFTSGSSPATSTSFPATSPIAIDGSGGIAGGIGGGTGCFGAGTKGGRSQHGGSSSLFRYDFEESPISPVSGTIKSKSAPAFPFSPPAGALSPRFLRNAQQQRLNRTRYPSERSSVSERSSIGSDEQLSDDDLSYLLDSSNGYSPLSGHQMALMGGLPVKMGQATRSSGLLASSQMLSKVLNRNLFKFGRAPLLGTLEESLLQRRLSPKFQVADFKVLLGASGSFCPTQLTIPVASYFYELPGQHLTTPYVCELRLPRKGYSIPRSGTVQATLLNPLGTVVRMFVVPYDFRDMPAMSTTFIRQRILACDESSLQLLGKNIEQLSNAEQMKLLRYAIHLRFQTSRSGKLSLHTDIRLLISRRTDCDTAAAHAKNLLESPNELKVVTIVPENPKFSLRIDKQ